MDTKKYKVFSIVSLIIVSAYAIIDVWFILNVTLSIAPMGFLSEIPLPLNIYSWHVFTVFSLGTLAIKCYKAFKKENNFKGMLTIDVVLHFLFTTVALIAMYLILFVVFVYLHP